MKCARACHLPIALAAYLIGAIASPCLAQSLCPPGVGNALGFDGIDDRASFGNVLPGSSAPHTIEAWVRIPRAAQQNGEHHIAGQLGLGYFGLDCCTRGFGLLFGEGVVYYALSESPCGPGPGFVSDLTPELDAWHHYAGTWDGTEIKLYRDGLLVEAKFYTDGFDAWDDFTLGASSSPGCQTDWHHQFEGVIDEVRLWDHAREQLDIASDINQLLCGTEAGLIGYWPIEEGTGLTTVDLSPGGNDGSIDGAEWVQVGSCFGSYCFGDGACPCGNNDPSAGCTHSIGGGALLQASGTQSVSGDDLVLTVSSVLANQFGILFMGGGQSCGTPFGDGLLCVSPGPASFCRFPVQNSGPGGTMTEGPGIVAFSQTLQPECNIVAGDTWNFQGWYRDPQGPCGGFFNLSNAVSVTFGP